LRSPRAPALMVASGGATGARGFSGLLSLVPFPQCHRVPRCGQACDLPLRPSHGPPTNHQAAETSENDAQKKPPTTRGPVCCIRANARQTTGDRGGSGVAVLIGSCLLDAPDHQKVQGKTVMSASRSWRVVGPGRATAAHREPRRRRSRNGRVCRPRACRLHAPVKTPTMRQASGFCQNLVASTRAQHSQ
jgi:hypothetical protein